jgi:hypothetical protein
MCYNIKEINSIIPMSLYRLKISNIIRNTQAIPNEGSANGYYVAYERIHEHSTLLDLFSKDISIKRFFDRFFRWVKTLVGCETTYLFQINAVQENCTEQEMLKRLNQCTFRSVRKSDKDGFDQKVKAQMMSNIKEGKRDGFDPLHPLVFDKLMKYLKQMPNDVRCEFEIDCSQLQAFACNIIDENDTIENINTIKLECLTKGFFTTFCSMVDVFNMYREYNDYVIRSPKNTDDHIIKVFADEISFQKQIQHLRENEFKLYINNCKERLRSDRITKGIFYESSSELIVEPLKNWYSKFNYYYDNGDVQYMWCCEGIKTVSLCDEDFRTNIKNINDLLEIPHVNGDMNRSIPFTKVFVDPNLKDGKSFKKTHLDHQSYQNLAQYLRTLSVSDKQISNIWKSIYQAFFFEFLSIYHEKFSQKVNRQREIRLNTQNELEVITKVAFYFIVSTLENSEYCFNDYGIAPFVTSKPLEFNIIYNCETDSVKICEKDFNVN